MAKKMHFSCLHTELNRTLEGGWVVVFADGDPSSVGFYVKRANTNRWEVFNRVQHPREKVGHGRTMREALLEATKVWGCSHCTDTHTSSLEKTEELHYGCKNGEGRYYLVFNPEEYESSIPDWKAIKGEE